MYESLCAEVAGSISWRLYHHKLRLCEERRASQQLVAAADAPAAASIGSDLTRVLYTGASQAAVLFPATIAEVASGGRLVRAGPEGGVSFGRPLVLLHHRRSAFHRRGIAEIGQVHQA